MKDISCAVQVSRAALHVRGGTTIIRLSKRMEIVSLSSTRVCFFLGVQLGRVAIAALLWYGGTYFLVSTINITELILNTVCPPSSREPSGSILLWVLCSFGKVASKHYPFGRWLLNSSCRWKAVKTLSIVTKVTTVSVS